MRSYFYGQKKLCAMLAYTVSGTVMVTSKPYKWGFSVITKKYK